MRSGVRRLARASTITGKPPEPPKAKRLPGKHGNALSSVATCHFFVMAEVPTEISSSCHLSDFVFVVICPPPALAWPAPLLSFLRSRLVEAEGRSGAAGGGLPGGCGCAWLGVLGVVRLAGNLGGVSGGGRRERRTLKVIHGCPRPTVPAGRTVIAANPVVRSM